MRRTSTSEIWGNSAAIVDDDQLRHLAKADDELLQALPKAKAQQPARHVEGHHQHMALPRLSQNGYGRGNGGGK